MVGYRRHVNYENGTSFVAYRSSFSSVIAFDVIVLRSALDDDAFF